MKHMNKKCGTFIYVCTSHNYKSSYTGGAHLKIHGLLSVRLGSVGGPRHINEISDVVPRLIIEIRTEGL